MRPIRLLLASIGILMGLGQFGAADYLADLPGLRHEKQE